MASGYYPLDPETDHGGAILRRIANELKELLDHRGGWGLLPSADENVEYDNAASDGRYEQCLYIALELIERCLKQST